MFFESEFLMALLTIIAIDILLAGDNAVVIAMASRSLPPEQRKKAILWGTAGAVGIRIALTTVAVWLLKIPLLMAVGGLLLVWVAIKLMAGGNDEGETIQAGNTLGQAIKTILVADVIMGVDNVLAIAGAAHGNILLVVIGLMVSIPIVVWGSQWIVAWMNRWPSIIYIGAGILAWTAASMFTHDPMVQKHLLGQFPSIGWIIQIAVVAFVLLFGKLHKARVASTGLKEKAS
jgi:YjbE family integral membrane protein